MNLYLGAMTDAAKDKCCSDVMDLMAKGVITPYCGTVFDLKDFKEAFLLAMKPARGGKVLLSSA